MRRYYESDTAHHMPSILTTCPPKCMPRAMIVMFVVSVMVVIMYIFQPLQNEIHVLLINMDHLPVHRTNDRYLSVALDASLIANGFNGFDMNNRKLRNMMKALGGGYLRIGGKMADELIFVDSSAHTRKMYPYLLRDLDGGICAYEEINCLPMRDNFTLSSEEWIELNELAQETDFRILFDLNSLQRTMNGRWNSQNAEKLIAFSDAMRYQLIWELGNEPNAYRHVFNYELSGKQLAEDFQILRQILNRYNNSQESLLVGPDVTKPKYYNENPRQFLIDFLTHLQPKVLDAITWHQYYFRGKDATLNSFLNPDVYDSLEFEILAIKSAARLAAKENLPIWLGETSSAYGGGSAIYSDKFAGTFIWMDKLGLAAKNGIDLVVRQSLFKGYYALLDDSYNPNPDWWISVLYKKLVGPEVLECLSLADSRVRMYCHCANKNNEFLDVPAIVVFGFNVNYATAYVRIEEANANFQNEYKIEEFLLQTHVSMIFKDIYLNGNLLEVDQDGKLPKFKVRNFTSNVISLPPYSLGFWLIQHPKAFKVCGK